VDVSSPPHGGVVVVRGRGAAGSVGKKSLVEIVIRGYWNGSTGHGGSSRRSGGHSSTRSVNHQRCVQSLTQFSTISLRHMTQSLCDMTYPTAVEAVAVRVSRCPLVCEMTHPLFDSLTCCLIECTC